MSLYSLYQKIKYRKAKSRHGVHSPFVYDFVEKILNGKQNISMSALREGVNGCGLSAKQSTVLSMIYNYYSIDASRFDKQEMDFDQPINSSLLYVFKETSGLKFPFKGNDVVVLLDINSSKERFRQWSDISQHPEVRLSIDIFEMGILFFRKDFLVKQHFVLKY